MTRRKAQPDTTMTLALVLAQERHANDKAKAFWEVKNDDFLPTVEDYLPDALAFVVRCRKAEAL